MEKNLETPLDLPLWCVDEILLACTKYLHTLFDAKWSKVVPLHKS